MTKAKTLAEGVRFLAIPDARFKTAKVTVALFMPLCEDTVAAQALLPYVLSRSCKAYPDFSALQQRLSELYGADIVPRVLRVGENQVLTLSAVSLEDRFALDGENVTVACVKLLEEMLFHPVLENGVFREADVQQEKRCLKEQIESEINDKRLYARRECERLLCKGEPYAISLCGTVEQVSAVTPALLTETWKRVLAEAQVLIVHQGQGAGEEVGRALSDAFSRLPRRPLQPVKAVVKAAPETVERQTKRIDVKQAKLVMGFRTETAEPSSEMAAMRLFNALWGGCFSSLLFLNVREKLSLCYYCSSSFDRYKGVFLVDSGVEEAKAAEAEAEILRQLDVIQRGAFTEEELENARRAVVNQFKEATDSPAALVTWYVGQGAGERFLSPEEATEEVVLVTREQVAAVAADVKLACVYCLCGEAK